LLIAGGLVLAILVVRTVVSRETDSSSFRFSDHLSEAKVYARGAGQDVECEKGFNTRFRCDVGHKPIVSRGMQRCRDEVGYKLRRRILFRPFKQLHTFIEFDDVKLRSVLRVRCGNPRTLGNAHVPLRFHADGDLLGEVKCPLGLLHLDTELGTEKWRDKTVKITIEVFNDPNMNSTLTFDAWVVEAGATGGGKDLE
jgi:hypothetical protein